MFFADCLPGQLDSVEQMMKFRSPIIHNKLYDVQITTNNYINSDVISIFSYYVQKYSVVIHVDQLELVSQSKLQREILRLFLNLPLLCILYADVSKRLCWS